MLDKVIVYSFYILFFLTPLIWMPFNSELFEYNKMTFVYLLTTVIVSAWILKMISSKSLIFKRSPLDIPIVLFLIANILSTIFSIDPHTSLWGYYSRSNGGLLSIICYTLLFYGFISNLDKERALKSLKYITFGGLLVALWAIPEHFGVSPSCLILRGELNASCWVQNVQARVFATLGQPNWLGAYLAMLIFPALYFLLQAKSALEKGFYFLATTALYLAFTFTYSRGAMLGFLTGLIVFIPLLFKKPELRNRTIITIITFITINLFFGSAITRFQLTQFLPKAQEKQMVDKQKSASSITQLETGGTESGKIRLIVWKGAWEIFKHYPIFGSGVETFAYSYYQFRPVSHNSVSEWDFLYNKAHNEFLNYLATTGVLGLGSYSIIIITFIIFNTKYQASLILKKLRIDPLLSIIILASYISYLVQNFFGFSVVIIALFFYLFPAITFVMSDSTKVFNHQFSILSFFYHRPIYTKALKLLVFFLTFYFLFTVIKYWYADTYFALGEKSNESGNPGRAYNFLTVASSLNQKEPLYKSELGFAASLAALALEDSDATLSAQLKDQATEETEDTLKNHPKNISFFRTAVRTYYQIAALDQSFNQKTLDTIDQALILAPTDAKLYYNKAVILEQLKKDTEAIQTLEKTLQLKPNYKEAYFALAQIQFDKGEDQKAVQTIYKVLTLIPGDSDALKQLTEWGKQGIATQSGSGN